MGVSLLRKDETARFKIPVSKVITALSSRPSSPHSWDFMRFINWCHTHRQIALLLDHSEWPILKRGIYGSKGGCCCCFWGAVFLGSSIFVRCSAITFFVTFVTQRPQFLVIGLLTPTIHGNAKSLSIQLCGLYSWAPPIFFPMIWTNVVMFSLIECSQIHPTKGKN